VTSDPTYDILMAGTPSVDLTFALSTDALPHLGQECFADAFAMNPGAPLTTAFPLTRLGIRVGLRAHLGNDPMSRFVADRMREIGMCLDLIEWIDRPMPIISAGISLPHDRLFITYDGTDAVPLPPLHITVADLDRYRPRALTVGIGTRQDVILAARRRGILLFLDTYWDLKMLHSSALQELLPLVDVFSPNLPEALEMTGTGSAAEALDVLSGTVRRVAIKMGGEGCLASCDGNRFVVPAVPVCAVDTTGAGDNFDAGLIYGLLTGRSFEMSLHLANIAGGLSTTVHGGSNAAISPGMLEEYAATVYGDIA